MGAEPLVATAVAKTHTQCAPQGVLGKGAGGGTNDAHSKVQKITFVSVVLQRLAPLPNNLSEITRVPPLINMSVIL